MHVSVVASQESQIMYKRHASIYPAGNYMFKANNRNTHGVKYVQR